MANNYPKPTFSVCVPTYNRGVTALAMVFSTLPAMDQDWELLILDNASDHEVESYQEIEKLSHLDQRLRYIRHPANRGFHSNFLACFDYAKSAHIMLISDEDHASIDMIRNNLGMLQARSNLAILRGSTSCFGDRKSINAFKFPNKNYKKGEEALIFFCLKNNYMSGIIYNREIILKSGLIELLRADIEKNKIYPHLYLELLACALFEVATTEEICCLIGEERPTVGNKANDYTAPYAFGSRIDQLVALRDGIYQAVKLISGNFDIRLFMIMYLELCNKYMQLVSQLNNILYAKNNLNVGLLQSSFIQFCVAGIIGYPEIDPYQEIIFTEIQKIYTTYKNNINIVSKTHNSNNQEIPTEA